MNPKCRLFKGVYLDPSSKAYSLLSERKEKEAEALVKECLKRLVIMRECNYDT